MFEPAGLDLTRDFHSTYQAISPTDITFFKLLELPKISRSPIEKRCARHTLVTTCVRHGDRGSGVRGVRGHTRDTMATLAEKLSALRHFFGIAESVELPRALATMREAVRVPPEGDLIMQVDAIIAATRTVTSIVTVIS